jgi:hypothetical protein
MKEIDQTKRTDDRWKSVATIAIALIITVFAGGLYINESKNNEELIRVRSRTQVEIESGKAREANLAQALAEARKQAEAHEAALIKERAEVSAKTQASTFADKQAEQREKKLADTISALNEELSMARSRLTALTNISEPPKTDDVKRLQMPPSPVKETPEALAARRKEDLLKKFNKVSDQFTRPKVYLHDVFVSRLNKCEKRDPSCGKCAFFDLTVNTDGMLIFGGYKFNSLQVLHEGDVINIYKIEDLQSSFEHKFSDVSSLQCRLKWQYFDFKKLGYFNPTLSSSFGSVDIDLNADDLMALRETFELAQSFKATK